MTDRPPSKPGPRRATSPAKIKTGPDLGKVLPYVVGAAVLAALVFLIRTPRYTTLGALLAGLTLMTGLGYVGLSYRISLPPTDRLRAVLPIVTIATLLAAAVPFAYTLYPPPPRGTVALSQPGDAQSVDVVGTSSSLWLTVHGRFAPGTTVTGNANYFLTVAGPDGAAEHVNGELRPHAGGPLPERHGLSARGPGRFTVRLEQISPSVATPLRVDVNAKPFSTLTLGLFYAVLATIAVAIDVMLSRRNIEPSFAAAMIFPLVAVVYLQRRPASDSLPMDLLAAGVIGALAGGLGGELLARLARNVGSR